MITDVERMAMSVEGWLSYSEGKLLYNLAKNCTGKGVIVEVGSWKGKSTVWLGCGSKAGNGVRIYAVDPHTGSAVHKKMYGKVWTFEEFKRNIKAARVDDVIVPLVKTSADAAKKFTEPVELIFIDGDHEYDSVRSDFESWFPKVVDGGIMAFHDTVIAAGPRKVLKDMIYKSENFKNIVQCDSITYAEKVKRNSFADRFRNRILLALRNSYVTLGKMPLPNPIRVSARGLAKAVKLIR